MNKLTRLELPSLAVFDLDGTLYDYEKSNLKATKALISYLSLHSNVGEDLINQALFKARAVVKNRLGATASSHSRLLYISEIFRILNLEPNTEHFVNLEDKFWRIFFNEMELFVGVKEFLTGLKNYDIPLALVTDLTSRIQYQKITELKLNGIFNYIVTSEESGNDKITGSPFEMLKNVSMLESRRTWFFGDSEFDRPARWHSGSVFFRKTTNKKDEVVISETKETIDFSHYPSLQNSFELVSR